MHYQIMFKSENTQMSRSLYKSMQQTSVQGNSITIHIILYYTFILCKLLVILFSYVDKNTLIK